MTNQQKNNAPKKVTAELKAVSDGQFLISGDLDFDTVPAMWKVGQSLFNNSQPISIDLSGVNRSDSSGLALLLEWMRLADSKAHSIKFLNLPDQMREIAQVCGVDEKLPV